MTDTNSTLSLTALGLALTLAMGLLCTLAARADRDNPRLRTRPEKPLRMIAEPYIYPQDEATIPIPYPTIHGQ